MATKVSHAVAFNRISNFTAETTSARRIRDVPTRSPAAAALIRRAVVVAIPCDYAPPSTGGRKRRSGSTVDLGLPLRLSTHS